MPVPGEQPSTQQLVQRWCQPGANVDYTSPATWYRETYLKAMSTQNSMENTPIVQISCSSLALQVSLELGVYTFLQYCLGWSSMWHGDNWVHYLLLLLSALPYLEAFSALTAASDDLYRLKSKCKTSSPPANPNTRNTIVRLIWKSYSRAPPQARQARGIVLVAWLVVSCMSSACAQNYYY